MRSAADRQEYKEPAGIKHRLDKMDKQEDMTDGWKTAQTK